MAETLTFPTYEQIATLLAKLSTNYSNLASVFYEVFYYDTPADVTFSMYDENGILREYTIPNRAKDMQNLLSGNGTPEGTVEGNEGALYQDLTNGDLYIKETPNGAEGWDKVTTTNYLRNIFIQGNGDPEGNVEAPKGILYINVDRASLFIKTTITGNTGWEEISATTSGFANTDLSNLSPIGEGKIANRDLSNLTPDGESHFANLSLNNLNELGNKRFDEKEDVINKVTVISASSGNIQYPSAKCVYDELQKKQDNLVSGVNIKTINNNSIVGSGNLNVTTQQDVDSSIIAMLKRIYPVGAIYLGVMSVCPMAALFGTWVLVAANRCLQGSGTYGAGATIAAGLPNFSGSFSTWGASLSVTGNLTASGKAYVGSGGEARFHTVTIDLSNASSVYGRSSTVQPPAYVVNIWQRTS